MKPDAVVLDPQHDGSDHASKAFEICWCRRRNDTSARAPRGKLGRELNNGTQAAV